MGESWEELENKCRNCRECPLCEKRTNVVIGDGNREADLMLIGEGPGEQEDLQGLPFVGPAGQLLNLLFEALGMKRTDCYIANVVKCRPPGNRIPTDEEAEKCLPYLKNQVMLVKPKIVMCLGAIALRHVVNKDVKITQIRGQWIEKKGLWIMPTFHPAALLRDESKKILMWQDFKKVRAKLRELC